VRLPIALTAALLLLAPAGLARAVGENDPFREDGSIRYRFYTEVELLYIERDHSPSVEVTFSDSTNRELLDTDAVVDDDEEFGGRAVLGFRLNRTSSIEAVYMGWGHERSRAAYSVVDEDLNAFEFPELTAIDDESFDDAAVHDLAYDEDFHSAELNYRHALEVDGADYRFNLLAGIRAIRLEEDLQLTSFDELPVGCCVGTHNIAARNTLAGLQLGVETFVPLWEDRLDLDLLGVAGGYANQAKVRIDFQNLDGGPPTRYRASRSEWSPAGVFEAAAHLRVRLWPGVRMKLGYRAVYLVNIAQAPDQFARSGAASDFFGNNYDDDGHAVFHGPSIALGVDF